MVLRLVQRLSPEDASAAVGAALVPVLFRLGSAGREVLLGLLGLPGFSRKYPAGICAGCGQQAAISRGHRRLCHCQAQYLAGPSPWDTGPRHFSELGPGRHQLFFANMVAGGWRRRRKEPTPPPQFPPQETSGLAPAAAGPCQPELFTLPFEAVPWQILTGDWPRLGWYAHLVPAVFGIGERRG